MMNTIRKIGFRYLASGRRVPKSRDLQRFLDKQNLIGVLRQLKIDCVLDVGANRGQYARDLRKIGYCGEIHSFEPIPGDYALLQKASEDDALWYTYNFALGRTEGTGEFNVVDSGGSNTVFSSFLKPAHSMIPTGVSNIAVKIRTLDAMVNELDGLHDPARRVFLKLDTQGYDIEVCEGAKSVLPNIWGLQSEISVDQIYDQQPDYLDALRYYRGLGFSLMDLAIVNRNAQLAILEYDCIMARLDNTPA